MVKAYKECVIRFEGRISELSGMLLRLLKQVSKGTREPEQLKRFKGLIDDAHTAVQV